MLHACGRPRVATLSFLFLCGLASAQGDVVMSLSGPGTLPGGATVEDEELVLVGGASGPRRYLSGASLALYFGDRNGDGLMDEPNDIDALEIMPVQAGVPVIAGVYFSILTDQNGIKDGDIVRFDPLQPSGGLEIAYSEGQIVAAVVANDGNVDVDGMAFAPDGSLIFSLAEDELTGASSVVVADDDVLMLKPGATVATVLFTGAQLEAMAQNALGTSAAIADVRGLEFDGSAMYFIVQSPSSDDATVFSTAGGGSIVPGLAEAALGFGNAVEADALAFDPGLGFPCLELDVVNPIDGQTVTAAVSGLTPNAPFVLLVSGATALAGTAVQVAGFGALVIDPNDPWFILGVQNLPALASISDPIGVGTFGHATPAAVGFPYDLAVQALDAQSGRVSSPVLLEVNQ